MYKQSQNWTRVQYPVKDTNPYDLSILYRTEWHPKRLRFHGYKATGCFNSQDNFFTDHDIGEPVNFR